MSLGSLNQKSGAAVLREEMGKYAPGAEEPWGFMESYTERPERKLIRAVIIRAWQDAYQPIFNDPEITLEARRWWFIDSQAEGTPYYYLHLLNLSEEDIPGVLRYIRGRIIEDIKATRRREYGRNYQRTNDTLDQEGEGICHKES